MAASFIGNKLIDQINAQAVALQVEKTLVLFNITILVLFLLVSAVYWLVIYKQIINPIKKAFPVNKAVSQSNPMDEKQKKILEHFSTRKDQIGQLAKCMLTMDEAIASRSREQEILFETSAAVIASLDPQTVLDRILEQVERLLGVQKSAIVALDQSRGIFSIWAGRGLSEKYMRELTIQPTDPKSITMRALNGNLPLQISNVEEDESFAPYLKRALKEGFSSLLVIPFNTHHAPPSALLVYRSEPHVFSKTEIQTLERFANHATMAIENAILFDRSDTQLHAQTLRLEALVGSLNDGLILSDHDGNVVYANRRISELAGLSTEKIKGISVRQTLRNIFIKLPDPETSQDLIRTILTLEDGQRIRISLKESGKTIDLQLHVFDVTDQQGTPTGNGLILQDITADQELDRMRSSLVATVSHELRTPLASIKGYASTLLAEDVSWDQTSQREFLEIISNEADRLTNLVNNLLDLSRIESGDFKLSYDECPLEKLIIHAAQGAKLQADNTFDVHIDPGLPPLFADSQRLETVLRNLIENAVKYAGELASIRVEVTYQKEPKNLHIFRVFDNGPGIPQEEHKRIFKSFYRINDDLTRLATGTGLGLAICQGLVQAHGGEIWVEPKESGTCIAFSIPSCDLR
ncbi:MAG: PAS domain S-box protein [Anaerolineales bacterium]|nr:PAS domain S-box protein [Anaerolineales bacterium]